MKVLVWGAGYVGCVTGACLARLGHQVYLVEVSPHKLRLLRVGKSPVSEPGLAKLLLKQVRSGRLKVVDNPTSVFNESEMSLVCVGTPSRVEGSPDGRQAQKVLVEIAWLLQKSERPHCIVLRSTLPAPQVGSQLLPLLRERCGNRFGKSVTFALNPEFLREGCAIQDFFKPPFIVVGTEHPGAAAALKRLCKKIRAPFYVTAPGSASLLKYASNAFHAAKVVFGNEIASVSPLFKADPMQVMKIFCEDRTLNISPAYLRPGFAYGGSCLPKDLRALIHLARSNGADCPLLEAVPESNGQLIQQVLRKIEHLKVRRIALVGLSFKANTDDLRESSLVELAERLIGKGYEIRIFDPDVRVGELHGRNLAYAQQHLTHLTSLLCPDLAGALKEVQLVIFGKKVPVSKQALKKIRVPLLDLTRGIAPGDTAGTLLDIHPDYREKEWAADDNA